jgi:hypothetical protein
MTQPGQVLAGSSEQDRTSLCSPPARFFSLRWLMTLAVRSTHMVVVLQQYHVRLTYQ